MSWKRDEELSPSERAERNAAAKRRADEAREQYEQNRATREAQQQVRRERRARLEGRLLDLEERKLVHVQLLDPTSGHYRVWNRDRSKHADFWPSTGAILPPGRATCYGFENLLGYLGVGQNGKATQNRAVHRARN